MRAGQEQPQATDRAGLSPHSSISTGRCAAQAYLTLTATKGISAAESFCNSPSPSLAFSLLLSSWGGQQRSALTPHWSQSS